YTTLFRSRGGRDHRRGGPVHGQPALALPALADARIPRLGAGRRRARPPGGRDRRGALVQPGGARRRPRGGGGLAAGPRLDGPRPDRRLVRALRREVTRLPRRRRTWCEAPAVHRPPPEAAPSWQAERRCPPPPLPPLPFPSLLPTRSRCSTHSTPSSARRPAASARRSACSPAPAPARRGPSPTASPTVSRPVSSTPVMCSR